MGPGEAAADPGSIPRASSRPGPLALVGGDELNPGNEEQDEILVAAGADGPAFVLATAAGRQGPELAVAHARAWFARFGLDVEELPAVRQADVRSQAVARRAREGRFFYLVGGDPGRVPTTLERTPVWNAVLEAWRAGAALAGSSAGAMALGEWTLIRDRHPGDMSRLYRPALEVVPGVAVIPHFDGFGEGWVDGALRSRPRADAVLLGIDERSAALWRDGEWRALGPGTVTVLANGERQRSASGERIEGVPQPVVA